MSVHELREIRSLAEKNKKPDAVILTVSDLNKIKENIVNKEDKFASEKTKRMTNLEQKMKQAQVKKERMSMFDKKR